MNSKKARELPAVRVSAMFRRKANFSTDFLVNVNRIFADRYSLWSFNEKA